MLDFVRVTQVATVIVRSNFILLGELEVFCQWYAFMLLSSCVHLQAFQDFVKALRLSF